MAPSRRRSGGLLARVNFPLYAVQSLTSRHILVAGGGGSSKTGVANGFVNFNINFLVVYKLITELSGNLRNIPQWNKFLCRRSCSS